MSRFYGDFDPASTATTTITTEVVDTSSVVLYLPFDADIQDDSTVGTSMSAVGNAFVQSSLTQFGAKALYLDGSGDYLESVQKSSANSVFTLSSAAFTIDGWLYPQTFNEVISNFNASNPFAGFTASMNFNPHAAGKLAFFTSDGSAYDTSMASSTAFALNQWSHFAIVRGAISANSLEFFINGVKHGSHTVTREPGTSNNNVRIGASNNSQPNRQFQGAMDDLRIIKGVALYSTNFSVPTTAVGNSISIGSSTEDTRSHSHVWNYSDVYDARFADTWPTNPFDSRISLYLPFDTDFADLSSYNHTPTESFNGAQYVQTSVAQFGGSAFFDNNDDYVTYDNHSSFIFGSEDFTVEGFFNSSEVGSDGLIGVWGGPSSGLRCWLISFSLGNLYAAFSTDGNSATSLNSGVSVSTGQWYNFSFTREGSTFRLFVDGVLKATATNSSSLKNSSQDLAVGSNNQSLTSLEYFGYLDDIRITKGLALYTTAYTVPTQAVGGNLLVNP